VHERLRPYDSDIGRPSVDPELMIRMLIVGSCYGLRSERRLAQEVDLHLAYRWHCRLDLMTKFRTFNFFGEPVHRFRDSDVFRHLLLAVGQVKGEGFVGRQRD
jgi:transposase